MDDSKTPSDQVLSNDGTEGTSAAERSRAYRAQKRQIATLEAELADAKAVAADAQAALAATESTLADLRTHAAVADARHAGELAAAQAVAAERLRQIESLQAELAEARKAPAGAAQKPQKTPTSIERFDPDVLHREVLEKWFKHNDEHPNPVPLEERLRESAQKLASGEWTVPVPWVKPEPNAAGMAAALPPPPPAAAVQAGAAGSAEENQPAGSVTPTGATSARSRLSRWALPRGTSNDKSRA